MIIRIWQLNQGQPRCNRNQEIGSVPEPVQTKRNVGLFDFWLTMLYLCKVSRSNWKTNSRYKSVSKYDKLGNKPNSPIILHTTWILCNHTHRHSYQVITLTEKLQTKESAAAAAEPGEQTVAAQATAYAVLEGDKLCSGSAAAPAAAGTNDSPESYFAGARSPPSSPEDDDRAFFFPPDALLNNWAWVWNDRQY